MLVMLNLAASWKFLAIRMTTKCDSCQQTTKPTFLDLKSMADVKGLLMLPNTGVTLTKQEEPKLSQLSSALCLQPKVRPLESILHDSFSMPWEFSFVLSSAALPRSSQGFHHLLDGFSSHGFHDNRLLRWTSKCEGTGDGCS